MDIVAVDADVLTVADHHACTRHLVIFSLTVVAGGEVVDLLLLLAVDGPPARQGDIGRTLEAILRVERQRATDVPVADVGSAEAHDVVVVPVAVQLVGTHKV